MTVVFSASVTDATIPCRPVKSRRGVAPHRRLETWLWTGPVGHLVGGALDLLQALAYRRKRRADGGQRFR